MLSTCHADEKLQTNQPVMCQLEGMRAGCNQQSTIGERERGSQGRAAVAGCCSDCDCEDETNRYK